MKQLLKTLSVLLVLSLVASVVVLHGSALATELTAGNSKETATNIPQYGVEYVSSLSEAKEVDWFKFTTLSDDAYYFINMENYNLPGYTASSEVYEPNSVNLYLYDAYLQELAHGNNNMTRCLKLDNNTTYYIKVVMGANEKSATGNYEVSLEYKYDTVPNTVEGAVNLPLNQTSVNTFDGWKDIDWFKFTTTSAGEYNFELVNHDLPGYTSDKPVYEPTAPNIHVYDKYDKELKHSNNNTTFTLTLEANTTYYIKMLMGSTYEKSIGTYSISVSGGTVVTPPDTPITPPSTTKTLSSISIDTLPAKVQYTVGEELDISGIVVKAKYSDGTSAIVTNYDVYGFNSSKAGTSTVRVSYSEGSVTKTTAFSVVINEAAAEEPSDGDSSVLDSISAFFNSILEFFAMILEFFIDLFSSLA